ncbi:hypothetical protein CNBA1590 [Cryptococcus deneoformans B-3501A]|uniref:hypothetical protein n=1 Tax=Cryptococcus deneoformans (strain B-3501A) TaxID=283643 RepID=UPI0000430270|nr:hypothetical protein CNBA1590 [Cryptococcus neoformans var. neoformans B-3501A]EAL23512.1 hypothetical protein CNBA1590 [Cryptococcus neoformans var. neoformans B-3501A]
MANPFSLINAPRPDDGSPPRQSGSSKFVILGPNIGQYFEVSSSEGSSCSSSPSTPSHSPNRLNHQHSFDTSKSRSPSPTECDEIDRVEYSSPAIEMEACQMSGWDSSVSELSEGDSETETSVIITPDRDIRDGQSQRLDIRDIVRWKYALISLVKHIPNRLLSCRTTSSHTVVPRDFNRRCSESCSVTSASSSSFHAPQPGELNQHGDTVACEACGRGTTITNAKKIMPCQVNLFCALLFPIADYNGEGCHVCLLLLIYPWCCYSNPKSSQMSCIVPRPRCPHHSSMDLESDPYQDITPAIVEAFLPRNSLSHSTLQPIHILLDRFDGRTKDYLYIEAATPQAAQTILKTCQNTFLSGGALTSGRRRPVTITPVSHSELIEELRPHSAQELHSLLALCQAAIDSNSGSKQSTSKYIKSRHGPYYALMSTMSKMNGEQSPSYWDMFYVASGKKDFLDFSSGPLWHSLTT